MGRPQERLVVIETHPIQYHAPLYRVIQQTHGIGVKVIYGSDFSVEGYRDREFGTTFAWDVDLLGGYESVFIDRVASGGPRSVEELSGRGISKTLARVEGSALLLMGYSPAFHRRAITAGLRSRMPLLFRAETTDHARPRGTALTFTRDTALRFLYSRCARLLFIGKHSRDHYLRLGCPERKLVFSPYCVDTSAFDGSEEARARHRTRVREELAVRPEDKVVMYAGKLSERKGVLDLVAAARKLVKEGSRGIRLLFLGDGQLRRSVEANAATPPTVTATVTGFKNQSELSPYYHAADVLVLPSVRAETWGLVVNEALHHGLPCVVSDGVGCAPDLVDDASLGAVFPTGSTQGLAHALQTMLERPASAEQRAVRRERADAYSVANAAEGIARAYREAVNLS